MEYNWYIKEFKDKYKILQKLYKKETNENIKRKIKNTQRIIELCLTNELLPPDIATILEEDYIELTSSSYLWPYIKSIAKIHNDFVPNFSDDKANFSKDEIISLLHDFFKNGTNKDIYKLFCNIYENNKKNIHFIDSDELLYAGEIIYLEYFNKTYIQIFKGYSFEDISTFAHEFGHAIQFNLNYHDNLHDELRVYIEIISLFFELICLEYFKKSEYKDASFKTSYFTLEEHLQNSKIVTGEFVLLDAIKIDKYENKLKLRSNIENLIKELDIDLIRSIVNIRPSFNYIYSFSFLVATNLFMIYRKDPEKALYIANNIISLDGNLTGYLYLEELKKLNIVNPVKTKEYKELIHKRCRKLK